TITLVNPRGRLVTVPKDAKIPKLLEKGFDLPDSPRPNPQPGLSERRTPFSYRKGGLSVLIGCLDFSELTGMPMYYLNLGRELVKMGCFVTVVAPKVGGEIADKAQEAGIECLDYREGAHKRPFDVMLLSETWSTVLLDELPQVPAWNYLHSKYECDAPLPHRPQIRGYLAPREQVAEYWQEKAGRKIEIVPIPIDLERFKPVEAEKHGDYRILVPCTFNELREPMVRNILERAKDKKVSVLLKGTDYGFIAGLDLPQNVRWEGPSADIEKDMAWADEVAGIYVGTVTLEALAMGKKASVYDDEGNYTFARKPADFEATYGSESIARRFYSLFTEKWADIIIPHHDQTELLAQCLSSIPLRNYNVMVCRGGTFAQNCNKGARLAETDKLIFANDDLVVNPQVLWELVDAKEELVGVKQFYPDGEPLCVGIFINQFGNYELTNNPKKAMYPSGAFFRIEKEVFEEVGGFDERFRNGGEDQDLFLKVLEKGYRVGFAQGSVIHHCSQSAGRFDFMRENDEVLHELWPEARLTKVLGDHYTKESDLQFINEFGNLDHRAV
ncbi:MAG: galactosyltransferase-related protein, partial [Dehalococcoidales bacterium]|nr:galactosyltransferase-related protein [Dehalococcoidales bacterium]